MRKKLDRIFSLYIRNRDNGICITCGRSGEISEMQCGHFFSRSILSLRYNAINCNCQCKFCNEFLIGNKEEYEKALKRKYGADIIDKLRVMKNRHLKLGKADYADLIKFYRGKLKELL